MKRIIRNNYILFERKLRNTLTSNESKQDVRVSVDLANFMIESHHSTMILNS